MISLKKYFVLISVLFLIAADVKAQDFVKEIDAVMQQYMDLDLFAGSVLVAKDGKIVYAKAFGEANKDFHVKNTLTTKFNIGSIGKIFTGVSIMQLAEKGLLKISDPVIRYLPDFPFGDKITIHHLLTHTSGTYNYFAHPDFMAEKDNIRSVNDALKLIYDQKLLFKIPGERHSYSNSGIVILGAVIEKLTGMRYPDYIREFILEPTGMHDTGISYLEQIVQNRSVGYIKKYDGNVENNIYLVPPPNADGGIETTVLDLHKFDQALYGSNLVSTVYKEKMFTPFLNNYAYCWRVTEQQGKRVIGHGGGAPGVSAQFSRYVDDKYTLIVLSNYDRGAVDVSRTIEAILFRRQYDPPKISLFEYIYKNIREKGIDSTMTHFDLLLKDNGYKIRSSRALNFFGYELLRDKKVDMAIDILKQNAANFPDEANSYDSLAEAYLANGAKELAIKYYGKALEIDPEFENARKKLKVLIE